MASKAERMVINAAGLVQGIVLVTFPALSTIFTRQDRVRAVQQPVRGHVPAAGSAGDRRLAARRRAGPPGFHQAGLPARPGLQHRLDGAAAGQHAGQGQSGGRLPAAAGRDRVPRCRVRPDRPGAEYLHLGVPPRSRGPLGAGAERPARARHRAGSGAGSRLRGPGLLVGAPDRVRGAAGGSAAGQPSAAAAGRGARRRGRAGPAGHSGPVLAVRGVRRLLRHLRDDERQLVPAGHDHPAGWLGHPGLAGPGRVLGHGHRRAGAVRARSTGGCRSGSPTTSCRSSWSGPSC